MDWMNEWEEDLWMEANCSDGPGPDPTDGPGRIIISLVIHSYKKAIISFEKSNANNNF